MREASLTLRGIAVLLAAGPLTDRGRLVDDVEADLDASSLEADRAVDRWDQVSATSVMESNGSNEIGIMSRASNNVGFGMAGTFLTIFAVTC